MGESNKRASWNKVRERSRENLEGYSRKPRRDTVHREVCGVQDSGERKDRNKGQDNAKKQGEGGGALRDVRGVKRRNRNENVSARPNGLLENAETAISCGGPGPARKKSGTSSREEDEHADSRCRRMRNIQGGTGCVEGADEQIKRMCHGEAWYTR